MHTAGVEAERLANLFWLMAGGAALIWLAVMSLALYARTSRRLYSDDRAARFLIIGAGTVLPTVVLSCLLAYGLYLLPEVRRPAPPGSLQIAVSGEQWWWRVRYLGRDGGPVELANELRLPVGKRVEVILTSADVIHSFWIPSLAGKLDMVPGHETRLTLEPIRTGVFRGACAEYCGTAHALMNFPVVVMESAAFDRWLESQSRPAEAPSGAVATRGSRLFLANGCGACHSVRGTPADGRVGPDLTHVGGRESLGAGILPNDIDSFRRWIGRTSSVKPGVRMPSFGMLPEEDLRALAAYLDGLQ